MKINSECHSKNGSSDQGIQTTLIDVETKSIDVRSDSTTTLNNAEGANEFFVDEVFTP